MIKINIKALSVNKVWRGRRFKTDEYKAYETELYYQLPFLNMRMSKTAKLEVKINVGFSSKNSDVDNVAKPMIDIFQKKYLFNDKQIYRLTLEKFNVKKGEEYIEFKILPYLSMI